MKIGEFENIDYYKVGLISSLEWIWDFASMLVVCNKVCASCSLLIYIICTTTLFIHSMIDEECSLECIMNLLDEELGIIELDKHWKCRDKIKV